MSRRRSTPRAKIAPNSKPSSAASRAQNSTTAPRSSSACRRSQASPITEPSVQVLTTPFQRAPTEHRSEFRFSTAAAAMRGAPKAPRSIENRNSERCSVGARWNGVVNTCTDGSVIGEACERRQALELRGAVVEFCALLAALLGFEFGAIFARGVERLRDIRRIGRSVGESVGQLDWILEL